MNLKYKNIKMGFQGLIQERHMLYTLENNHRKILKRSLQNTQIVFTDSKVHSTINISE